MKVKNIVVWAGLSWIVIAQRLAEKWEDVLIIEKRNHIWWNCYDYRDENWFLIHKYWLHIFHTSYDNVREYIKRFWEFTDFQLRALSFIDWKNVTIPFNLNSIYQIFSNELAKKYENILLSHFKYWSMVSILEMIDISNNKNDKDLKFITDYIFEKVFKNYIIKQWWLSANEIDKNILNRMKVSISRDDRYFKTEKFQWMPIKWYTGIFNNMINHKNIKILLNTDYKDIVNNISYEKLYYTWSIDNFFDYKYWKLEYRKTKFVFEKHNIQSYQDACMVSYPNDYRFTRITEFKKFYPNNKNFNLNSTIICKEFPWEWDMDDYPIEIDKNLAILKKYKKEAKKLNNVVFLWRQADYKYYDMDDTIYNALNINL